MLVSIKVIPAEEYEIEFCLAPKCLDTEKSSQRENSGPPDESYTVGWICALQTELDAAINMLDKGYKKRFGDGNDKHVYVPGRIGSHYVVITALPMGWMGNNTAAMVATRMMIKFQNIQVGLLVGIGGGFPNKEADIRLGDVVVSKPDGRFNGVVQYDLGKYTKDGFQRMGAMNAPPERILAVLQFMPPHGTFLGKQPMSPYPGESFDQLYDRDDDGGQEELVVREYSSTWSLAAVSDTSNGQEYIADAAPGTCGWLLEEKAYKEWKLQENGLLWLTGKPGSGKSTLLKYALLKEIEQHDNFTISFFFHKSNSNEHTISLNLYRCLLGQLIGGCQERRWYQLTDTIKQLLVDGSERGRDHNEWIWHPNELSRLLRDCIRKVLEKCAVQTLQSDCASAPSRLSVFIACRQGSLAKWQAHMDNEIRVGLKNQSDIKTYLLHNLEKFEDEKQRQELEDDMLAQSSGVFLWITLVCPKVVAEQRKGRNVDEIRQSLRTVLSELSDIFKNILEKLAEEQVAGDSTRSLRLFQWLCFSTRPLSLTELRWAMNMSINNPFSSLDQCLKEPSSIRNDAQMAKQLSSFSGGLIEVRDHQGVARAQLIHQSVKEFLINQGFRILSPSVGLSATFIGHANAMLSRACIRYLSMEEIVAQQDNTDFPFLSYAAISWTRHAEQSERMGISQGYILTSFQWPSERLIGLWVRIAMQSHRGWPVRQTNLLHATARHGLTSAVTAHLWGSSFLRAVVLFLLVYNSFIPFPATRQLLKLLHICAFPGQETDCKDGLGRTALSLAAARGHVAVVQLLLSRDDVDVNSVDHWGRTPLSWASAAGQDAVVGLLISHKNIKVNLSDDQGRTPLFWAVVNEHEGVMLELLRENADITTTDGSGATALHVASRRGHEDLSRHLLEHGASIEAKDKYGRTALHEAALYGRELVVQLLLSKGANVAVVDTGGDTVLHRAAGNRDPTIARRLLDDDRGVSAIVELVLEHRSDLIYETDNLGGTALHRAASSGRVAVTKLLLAKGVRINGTDYQGRTALDLAEEENETEIVRLLEESGADKRIIQRQSVTRGTRDAPVQLHDNPTDTHNEQKPLELASRNGDVRTVRRLLDAGEPVTYSALAAASEEGFDAVVQLILTKDPGILRDDANERSTALHLAAGNGHEAVVQMLIQNGADVNKNSRLGTPLHWAAGGGVRSIGKGWLNPRRWEFDGPGLHGRGATQDAIVELLLRSGASVSTQSCYTTALDLAAGHGDEAVVRLILESGATVTLRTLLSAAAREGNETAFQLLLENGTTTPCQALAIAAALGNEAICRMLLKNGVDATQSTIGHYVYKVTALQLAAKHGHDAIVRLLLEQNVDVNGSSHYIGTPLHEAARNGHETIVGLLLDKRADVNREHHYHGSPLSVAIENKHDGVVRLLLENGAFVDGGGYSHSPLRLAAQMGIQAIVQQLLEHGADGTLSKQTLDMALQAALEANKSEVARLLEEYIQEGAGNNSQW
ncbi:Serine/threonine-protein phosphatase 6 regulatory ankyrin repeat subunit C [Talaromyces pinophilus]|nr:Serine/threonine-protein phosphatase 6 regulatory ankyrin repeat subunit C [Talaromyces pinophilus]